MDVYEAIATLRSMRRLKPDPVPDALVKRVLDAAIHAASGGNMQNWAFVVVRDAEKKRRIAEWYSDGLRRLMASGYGQRPDLSPEQAAAAERTRRSAQYLADHMAEAPVLIFCCLMLPPGASGDVRTGSSIYPAVQNLMLAARAEGLGTTLTTLYSFHDDEVKDLLGIPRNVVTAAMIPMGWPMGRFGEGPRKPLREVTYIDSWGNSPAW
ncbi:MAG: nitroreductase family protein [Chloroflexi bacterium]|nr:nitroreductase family protein [Chloroflexota bacterium]